MLLLVHGLYQAEKVDLESNYYYFFNRSHCGLYSSLYASIENAGLVYKLSRGKLERLGIKTVQDLLYHIPFRYENYSLISPVNITQPEEVVTIKGKVTNASNRFSKFGKKVQRIVIEDTSGSIPCIWFNQPFVLRNIKANDLVSIAGKVGFYKNEKVLMAESYETLSDIDNETNHTGRLIPIYPETRGISSKWIRNRIKELLVQYNDMFSEFLPDEILANNNLIDYRTAITQIHFPSNEDMATKVKHRLAFDELFLTQLCALLRRKEWQQQRETHFLKIAPFRKQVQEFWEKLPFELTNAQKKEVRELFSDLASSTPMNRLL